MEKIYDVIVLGGGPAGCTAAMYCARSGLETLLVEKMSVGGQMNQTTQIDNYPGFDEGVDGFGLGMKMHAGAQKGGAQTKYGQVASVELTGEVKTLQLGSETLYAKTVILATGAEPRPLGLANEAALMGRGVSYCAFCDGMFYRNKTVVVVGGGNSAAADAMLLSRICKKVILVHRRDTLRATKIYHEPLMKAENVDFRWNRAVVDPEENGVLTGVKIRDLQSGSEEVIPADGLFVSIGRAPATALFQGQLELDAGGYILAGEDTATSIPGVFAVGDVRTKQVRQIITAASDGAVAAHMAEEYLLEH